MTTVVDVGAYVPATSVSIHDVAEELDLDRTEFGVFERFFGLKEIRVATGEDLADILVAAGRAVPGLAGNEHRVRYVLGARTIATVAPVGRNPLHEAADRLGLDHAVVLTFTQHACASALLAVHLAGRMLAADGDPDGLALVLTGEKAFSPGSRTIPGTTVMGEGTAACLVSAHAPGDEQLAYATRTLGEYHQVPLPPDLLAPFGALYTSALAEVVAEAVEQAGLTIDDVRLVLPHNVNRVSWKRVSRTLGLPLERVFLDNVPVTGHCFGADPLIGYAHVRSTGVLRDGDPYVLAAVGLGATFSAMVLRYRDADAAPAAETAPFVARVKEALTGDAEAPLVLLGNFEVEDEWARGEVGLPSVGGATATTALVNRMDELAVLLAGADDHVVLKSAPDPDHLAYLTELGLDLPTIHVAEDSEPDRTVTRDALASPLLLERLRGLAADGVRLLAHGTSEAEEELAAATGLTSVLSDAATTRAVNSKVYSRELCDELGIEQARGWACRTVADLENAVVEARAVVEAGGTVGVKDAYGVSGKGILVVDDPRRLDQLLRMVQRRAARTGDDRLAVVVEVWADKATDLNYHFTVARDGGVTFDFVKEAITEGGVHKGHRIPARLPAAQVAEIERHAGLLGARLARDGFHGVVGVDALVRTDGSLLPVLEINARNNMSTYTVRLQERLLPQGWVALARQYPLVLDAPLSFAAVRDRLGDLLYTPGTGQGLVVHGTGTVNAGAATRREGEPFAGRLHGLLVAPDDAGLARLDAAVAACLTEGETS